MWPFNKNSKTAIKPIEEVCEHKYKDFSWYLEGRYEGDSKTATATIYKPYVCIHCGHRKDVVLDEICHYPITFEEVKNYSHTLRKFIKINLKKKRMLKMKFMT